MGIRIWAAAAAMAVCAWTGTAKADFLTINVNAHGPTGQLIPNVFSFNLVGLQPAGTGSILTGAGEGSRALTIGAFIWDASVVGAIVSAELNPGHWSLHTSFTPPLGGGAFIATNIDVYSSTLPGFVSDSIEFTLDVGSIVVLSNQTGVLRTLSADSGWAGISATVPEPSTWALMLLGFGGLAFAACRRSIAARAVG